MGATPTLLTSVDNAGAERTLLNNFFIIICNTAQLSFIKILKNI